LARPSTTSLNPLSPNAWRRSALGPTLNRPYFLAIVAAGVIARSQTAKPIGECAAGVFSARPEAKFDRRLAHGIAEPE